MRYLTKEWYDLCQKTGLHFGMRAHKDADRRDENLYLRLRRRKEKKFIKLEHEVYDLDPRFLFEVYGCDFVPIDKFLKGEEIREEDKVTFQMTTEEKDRINKQIEAYDSRRPFDAEQSKIEFNQRQQCIEGDIVNRIPSEVYEQIADPRVFALGYCTKEILRQLKKHSRANEKRVHEVLRECEKALKGQDIHEELRKTFRFHDCKVTNFQCGNDIIFSFDTDGGFSDHNRMTFHNAKIIKQEEPVEGSIWIYEELYYDAGIYEAHMLFAGESIHELTICCDYITIDSVPQ